MVEPADKRQDAIDLSMGTSSLPGREVLDRATFRGLNARYTGDIVQALGAIRARAIVMPSCTDLYFPPEDNAWEVRHMPPAELRPIPSIWGHMAGSPGVNPVDTAFIDSALKALLAQG